MPKKLLISFLLFVVVGALVFATGRLASPAVALPEMIVETTPCPVATCVQPDGACHAAAPAPIPDGTFAMSCPRVEGCADTSCHAWERIETSLRSQPSDISLNLWIIVPVLLCVGLVALVRKS
ncbi:MAG: hypothetical protein LBI64_06555 [Coriobacteriales bacterium]|nr:hypothetical protein [Coriobacteriales bacterium]